MFCIDTKGYSMKMSHIKKLTICPLHRDIYGVRWQGNKRNCAVPNEIETKIQRPKATGG